MGIKAGHFFLVFFLFFPQNPKKFSTQKNKTKQTSKAFIHTSSCTIREANLCQIFTTPAASNLPHPPMYKILQQICCNSGAIPVFFFIFFLFLCLPQDS
jgi:hypothetical protein